MLGRGLDARFRALQTLKHGASFWSVRIGGPVRGETHWFKTRQAAIAAVHNWYDDQLRAALYREGWLPHFHRVAVRATKNGSAMTFGEVVKKAWRRRRWKHTDDHRWARVNGRQVCTACMAASKRYGLPPQVW